MYRGRVVSRERLTDTDISVFVTPTTKRKIGDRLWKQSVIKPVCWSCTALGHRASTSWAGQGNTAGRELQWAQTSTEETRGRIVSVVGGIVQDDYRTSTGKLLQTLSLIQQYLSKFCSWERSWGKSVRLVTCSLTGESFAPGSSWWCSGAAAGSEQPIK